MKDMPVFTTSNGVASLILREIPYTQKAFIRIQNSLSPEELLMDCIGFCKAVGAEKIFATGHSFLERFSDKTVIVEMTADKSRILDNDAALFPVTQETAGRWCEIYNERMLDVPNAYYMTEPDLLKRIPQKIPYFVHDKGELLGIGMICDNKIDVVATVKRGSGARIVGALAGAIHAEDVNLEVASTNHKAILLYERLGFVTTHEISVWFRVSPE